MTINFRPARPEEEASFEKPGSGLDLRGTTMVASCDADHCTVEERAVIDAALEWERTGGAGGAAELEKPLFDALDTLLAAREKANDS